MATNLTSLILAALVGGAVMGLYFLLSKLLVKQKHSSDLTQRAMGEPEYSVGGSPFLEEDDDHSEVLSEKAQMMDRAVGVVMSPLGKSHGSERDRIRKQMLYAGIRSANAPVYYLFYQYIASPVLILVGLFYLYGARTSQTATGDAVIGLVILIVGGLGHKLFLKNRIEKRRKELVRSFPDMLDLLLVCVESGLALDAAIARVCSELGAAHPLITEELNRTRMELSVFSDRSKALHGLGERTNVTALKALAAALVQSEKFGTSLGDTLRVMSDDFRQTRLLMAEEKAAKLPALMTIPLITMLLPAMFLIILAPAFIKVMAQGGLFGDG